MGSQDCTRRIHKLRHDSGYGPVLLRQTSTLARMSTEIFRPYQVQQSILSERVSLPLSQWNGRTKRGFSLRLDKQHFRSSCAPPKVDDALLFVVSIEDQLEFVCLSKVNVKRVTPRTCYGKVVEAAPASHLTMVAQPLQGRPVQKTREITRVGISLRS